MIKPLSGLLLSVFITSLPLKIEYKAEEREPLKVLTVEDKIVISAKEYGLNPETMLAIAKAESRFNNVPNYKYTDENGKYTAYGIFQITRTTYKGFCGDDVSERMDIDKNIECAMEIAKNSGLHHWSESKHNWNG